MRRVFKTFLVVALLVASKVQPVTGQAGDTAVPTRSVQDGVYTEEQARRGEQLIEDVCAACHMAGWFTGTFLQSWAGTTVSALYEVISSTMPLDQPGALKRQQYADILAYIFELNGLPPGQEELGASKGALGEILIEWRE